MKQAVWRESRNVRYFFILDLGQIPPRVRACMHAPQVLAAPNVVAVSIVIIIIIIMLSEATKRTLSFSQGHTSLATIPDLYMQNTLYEV